MWQHLREDIINLACAVVYFVLCVAASVLYILQFRKQLFASSVFIVTFFLGVTIRGTFFLIQPLVQEHRYHVSVSVNFLINTCPTFFFFSTYMILLMMWGKIYSLSYDRNSFQIQFNSITNKKLSFVLIVVNTLMYLFMALMYVLDALRIGGSTTATSPKITGNPVSIYQYIVLIFTSFMYVGTTCGFFVYGYLIYKNRFYERVGIVRSVKQNRLLQRIGLLGFICIVCFWIRAFLTILQLIVPFANIWWINGVYYFCLEIIPLTLMLAVLFAATGRVPSPARLSPTSPLIT